MLSCSSIASTILEMQTNALALNFKAGWGLKPIHPFNLRCTKAFKSTAVLHKPSSNLLLLLWLIFSDLFSLLHLSFTSNSTFLLVYLSYYTHSQWLSTEEESRERKLAETTKHKEQQLCASVVHNRWKQELVEPRRPMMHWYIHTVLRKKQQTNNQCAQFRNQNHIWIALLYSKAWCSKL